MDDEELLRHLSKLPPDFRERAEKLFEVAKTKRLDPAYGGFIVSLREGYQPAIVAWLEAHESGHPYPLDEVWEKASRLLGDELSRQEIKQRVEMGYPADETEFDNLMYERELMQRDD